MVVRHCAAALTLKVNGAYMASEERIMDARWQGHSDNAQQSRRYLHLYADLYRQSWASLLLSRSERMCLR